MRLKSKPLLVVTDAATSINVPAKNVVLVTGVNRLFPAIFEFKPSGIVLDYDYIGADTEKILRRIRSNPYYNDIKIYCYKSRSHTKVDSFLKVLGVQYFMYADDNKQPKTSNTAKLLNTILEGTATRTVTPQLAEAAY
jgi:hypothetical protein